MKYLVNYRNGSTVVDHYGGKVNLDIIRNISHWKSVYEFMLLLTPISPEDAKMMYSRCKDIFIEYVDNPGIVHHLNNCWGGHAPLSEYFSRTYDVDRECRFYLNDRAG